MRGTVVTVTVVFLARMCSGQTPDTVVRLNPGAPGMVPSIVTKPAPDPTPSSVDVRVWPNNHTQSETSIAVSPTNNLVLLAASNTDIVQPPAVTTGIAYYVRSAQKIWSGVDVTPYPTASDPATAIDRMGRYYLAAVGPLTLSQGYAAQIVIHKSNDGAAWTERSIVSMPGSSPGAVVYDKEHIAINNSPNPLVPHRGRLYAAWTKFLEQPWPVEACWSDDQGDTWSAPINLSSAFGNSLNHHGINLQVGGDGVVYACWGVYPLSTIQNSRPPELGIGFTRSTDGGSTWEPARYAIDNIKGIRAGSDPALVMRVNSFPSMAADVQVPGRVYIAWSNVGPPGVNVGDVRLYVIRSDNGGGEWGAPVPVEPAPRPAGSKQYHGWIATDPLVANSLYAGYFDTKAMGTNMAEYYVAESQNGGTSFVTYPVSDNIFRVGQFGGFADAYGGDYSGIAARGGRVYPLWYAQIPDPENPGTPPQAWMSPLVAMNLSVAATTVHELDIAQYDGSESVTTGPDFVTRAGSQITITAGTEIRLMPGSTLSEGSTVSARIAPVVSKVSEGLQITAGRPRRETAAYIAGSPNPWNPTTTLRYHVPVHGEITVEIVDVAGRVHQRYMEMAPTDDWHGSLTVDGRGMPSGVYYAVMRSADQIAVGKLVLVR